jgi:hypothetical protein
MWRVENPGVVCEGICHVYIVINLRVDLYVINQSTLVLARVHIIHTNIRSYRAIDKNLRFIKLIDLY